MNGHELIDAIKAFMAMSDLERKLFQSAMVESLDRLHQKMDLLASAVADVHNQRHEP